MARWYRSFPRTLRVLSMGAMRFGLVRFVGVWLLLAGLIMSACAMERQSQSEQAGAPPVSRELSGEEEEHQPGAATVPEETAEQHQSEAE